MFENFNWNCWNIPKLDDFENFYLMAILIFPLLPADKISNSFLQDRSPLGLYFNVITNCV